MTALMPAAKAAAGAAPDEAIVVVVVALVVDVVAGMVDEGLGTRVAMAAGAGTVDSEVGEVVGAASELRAVAPVPLHPLRVNRGSEIETAAPSQ